MHRKPGVSGFPSMAGFMGEKPTKRPRMQEPQKEKTFANIRLPEPEAAEEEVWEDLDDDAMDECMMLATQMCTEPLEEQKEGTSSTSNHNDAFNFPNRKNDQRNNLRSENHTNKGESVDHLGDSGFSSTRGTSHDTSRVFYNSVKTKNSSNKGNAFASRFNDFTPLVNSQKLSSVPKQSQNSGKVYNSIPLKGSFVIGNSSRGTSGVYPGTSKGNATDESRNMSKNTDIDTAKLQEDVLLKQGEISVLRSELKRKEAALEAERLDRCTVIEAAEKRGREKAAVISSEAEAKIKQCNRKIEKLQDELHFKNHEIQELETQCRRLEIQTQQQGASPTSRNPRDSLSQKVSPKKPCSNFKDRFDFSGIPVSKKNIEVQTEMPLNESRLRPRLDVTFSRGRGRGGRQVACLFSGAAKEKVAEPLTHTNRWTLDDEWSSVLSKLIADYEDCDDVQKQLLNLSIQRLEEVHVMFVSERADALRLPILKSCDPVDVYESHVVPPLSVIKDLTTTKCGDLSQKAIPAVCSHLPPLSVKDVVINSRIWPLVLQALDQLSRITTSQMDKTVCQLILERLRDCCETVSTSKKLVSLLHVLQGLTHHKHFMNNLCNNNEGSCFIGKLCSIINSQREDHLMIATTLQEWLAMVIMDAPDWLRSNCSCPDKLLAALLKQIHFALDLFGSTRGPVKTDLSKLLILTIRLLHCWSTKDSSWWEKVAHLPHYTAVMGAIINNAKEMHADRPTVDLLCDLYECDDKIFENC